MFFDHPKKEIRNEKIKNENNNNNNYIGKITPEYNEFTKELTEENCTGFL